MANNQVVNMKVLSTKIQDRLWAKPRYRRPEFTLTEKSTHADPGFFHKLYGPKRPRINYQRKDFIDYALMILISALVVLFCYGPDHLISMVGLVLCAFMIATFPVRHGVEFRKPVILKRPIDALYMFVYKFQNMMPVYLFALAVLLLENLLIFLTPGLPHHVELMRQIAIYLFYLHLILISAYRTAILVSHLANRKLVREVLMQSSWRSFISKQPGIVLEIVHAYFTGILTHIILIAPWFLVVNYANFSIIFLPVVCYVNIKASAQFLNDVNAWFYRDHWLGHNSELEFLYLHGTHHDAIPSGLIGVAGNGFLEGFLRHTLGYPTPFFSPLVAAVYYTLDIKQDIDFHQYIPGIFPRLPRPVQKLIQHSTHHFGHLEPYGLAAKVDQPGMPEYITKKARNFPDTFTNSIRLDEELTGFKWENRRYRWYLDLVDKYEKE